MSNEKLMEVVDVLRCLADSIERSCANEEKAAETQPVKAEKPAVTLEKVRGVLAEKSQKGFTAEVRALIRKHGAERLSDIDPECFPELLNEAEAIGNA